MFTRIHKFRTEPGTLHLVLSERDDIIVLTDEAHRSQYDTLAMNMRTALPKAKFVAFTGTPLIAGEERTRDVFGDYVSVYNFRQSVEDGATVPLFYENRTPELQITNPELNEEIYQTIEDAGLDDDQEEKLRKVLGQRYHLITREDRLDAVAKDIVHHFLNRGYQGKAMVVSIDKLTTLRMYEKVRAEWETEKARVLKALEGTSGGQVPKFPNWPSKGLVGRMDSPPQIVKAFKTEIIALLLGCLTAAVAQEVLPASEEPGVPGPAGKGNGDPAKARAEAATKEQQAEIRRLIEKLAFVPVGKPPADAGPKVEPKRKSDDPFAEEEDPPEIIEENRKRATACREAFEQLRAYKGLAIPFMLEHLDDKRPSMDFHGHWKHRDVGAACYWNIRYQFEDHPGDYSSYGYARKGRDGESHVKPYYASPGQLSFGGLKQWLMENAALSYTEKQLKCLRWSLEEEKKIGAPDPESYFENILPLEIRILQRRAQIGDDVRAELERLQKILKEKQASAIPPELLPPQVNGPDERKVE